jgi:hypothetical protein
VKQNPQQIDWVGFGVHFAVGSIFGAAIGLYLWARSDWAYTSSATPGLLIVSACSAITGLLAGCKRDDFWFSVSEGYRHLPWIIIKVLLFIGALLAVIFLVFNVWK